MKIIVSLLLSCLSCFAASEFDLRKGIDITGLTNITASQLNQLVDAGLISATNKGGILRRSGLGGGYWPDVTSNPRYTNFLWSDTYTVPATLKTYVPTGDAYTNWIPIGAGATITPGSITSAQLAANAVQTTNIANNAVTGAKINAGAIDNTHLQNGSVSNANIADLTIQSGKIANGGILSTNIAAGQLLPIHFTTASVNSNALATPGVATTNLFDNSVVSNKVAANAIGNVHLTGQAVRDTNIVSGTITSNQIASATIDYSNISTNTSYGMFKAFAFFNSAGTLMKGFGVSAAGMSGTADYFFTIGFNPTDTNRVILATSISGTGNSTTARVITNAVDGRIAVRVVDPATASATAAPVMIGVLTY